ncbi:MAG: hypothetical protein DCC58_08360 [Chloroflexi bacterium]|nr:MAG: hypothetical protein DCC58_08360 [Chloroflexota bacterium]
MIDSWTPSASDDSYPFRDLLRDVLSPGAVGALEQLSDRILDIYGLDLLLEERLPLDDRPRHVEALETRLKRVVRFLPPEVSPMPNEVYTAIEFLMYEIHGEPVRVGEAWLRLELLADEIRARPLLHDLVTGRAN